jgi:hypothetical protein
MVSWWQCPWVLDRRSLALSRVLLAFAVLQDIIVRSLYGGLQEHLTDVGSFPRELALRRSYFGRNSFPSIYFISGNYWSSSVLMSLHAVIALCMMVGYRVRFNTFLTWYMTTSLVIRNEELTTSGDQLLCIVLFWSMFVPMGDFYSVDVAVNRSRTLTGKKPRCNASYTICNSGSFAMLVQVTVLYVTASLLKGQTPLWQSGIALHHVLNMRFYTLPPANWLRVCLTEQLTYIATRAVLLTQLFVPVLLWLPVRALHGKCRLIAVVTLGLMHASIAVILNLHFFVLVDLAFLAAFLPPSAWHLISAAITPLCRRQRRLTAEWPSAFNRDGAGSQTARGQSSLDFLVCTLMELGCLQYVALRAIHTRQFTAGAAALVDGTQAGKSSPQVWLRVSMAQAAASLHRDDNQTAIYSESKNFADRHRGARSEAVAVQRLQARNVGSSAGTSAENVGAVCELLLASPVAWALAAPLLLVLPRVLPLESSCDPQVDDSEPDSEAETDQEKAEASGKATSESRSVPAAAVPETAADMEWVDPMDECLRRLMTTAKRGTDLAAAAVPLALVLLVLGLNARRVSCSGLELSCSTKRLKSAGTGTDPLLAVSWKPSGLDFSWSFRCLVLFQAHPMAGR